MIACRKLRKALQNALLQSYSNKVSGNRAFSSSSNGSPVVFREFSPKPTSSWPLYRSLIPSDGALHRISGRGPVYCRSFSTSSAGSPSKLSPKAVNIVGNVLLVIGCGVATYYFFPHPPKPAVSPEEQHLVTNWSGTHEAKTSIYIQPESLEELETAISLAHRRRQKLRPVGSGLSPNGIGLSDAGMINLALMDKIIDIDLDNKRVTVQAGARVEQVVEALRPHGLTLQNFASIKQQQIGGFTQVGAHGTGAALPPVDQQVLNLKLVTPAKGTLELSAEKDPDLFYLARCSLGTLGVVAEVTLQCVPMHKLLEHTFITTMKEVKKRHKNWLQENKHIKYLWIPDTDSVVVVKCNPLPEGKQPPAFKSKYTDEDRLKPVRALYKECALKYRKVLENKSSDGENSDEPQRKSFNTDDLLTDKQLAELSFTELRDKLLAMDPLNRKHVVQVNQVEAEYWKRCEGYRVGWSDEILGFDCGGQQWVSEVCFPVGSVRKPNGEDLKYMERLLDLIKKDNFPAPAPIEQRWTASSKSYMSPAFSDSPEALFSWVGIIMYLPTEDEEQRKGITNRFMEYRHASQRQLWDSYGAYEHWAKIEVDANDDEGKQWLQRRLRERFPIDELNKARKELDPNGILSNETIDLIFPRETVATTK
ncbi:hypothetical protein KP509_06G065800 [Ceratopteris richardii]|uniref:FAD-binding PCMH-type domain-containing protein n=1 Tax=Ceratopteris richardii TaxID=49495 RepID=A0A8T2UL47_CERRI|nr:hypothetical protein KP509_06G065800 [Ceratopteris richardii]